MRTRCWSPPRLTATTATWLSSLPRRQWIRRLNYWQADRRTPNPRIGGGAVQLVEATLASEPDHPQAAHLYIHLMENEPDPRKAEPAADRLARPLAPTAGHLVHMPAHIYYRLGRWRDSISANIAAARADEAWIRQSGDQGLVRYGYYPHNVHFIVPSRRWLATFAPPWPRRHGSRTSWIRRRVPRSRGFKPSTRRPSSRPRSSPGGRHPGHAARRPALARRRRHPALRSRQRPGAAAEPDRVRSGDCRIEGGSGLAGPAADDRPGHSGA